MSRILKLAIAAAAALSLAASTQVSAAPAPLMIDMTKAFDVDCTQERGVMMVNGNCQNSLFRESIIVGDAIGEGFPTGTVTFRKNPFKIGDVTLNNNNAANGKGQVVTAPGRKGYKYIQVLSMHVTGGPRKGGDATITYTDKSSVKVPLIVSPWGGAPGAVWTGGYQGAWHTPAGNDKVSIFIEELPINAKKAVASIKLPDFDGLRVFAMTLSNTSSALPKGPIFN